VSFENGTVLLSDIEFTVFICIFAEKGVSSAKHPIPGRNAMRLPITNQTVSNLNRPHFAISDESAFFTDVPDTNILRHISYFSPHNRKIQQNG